MTFSEKSSKGQRVAALAVASLVCLAGICGTGKPARAAGPAVDLALVLAVDSSSSVDLDEFGLQMNGLAAAFRDPSVIAAIAGGKTRRIAISVIEWSNPGWQKIDLPWRVLDGPESAEAFAKDLETQSRLVYGGATAIGSAIDFAVRLLRLAPVEAARQVIDVSGDGKSNEGRDPASARDSAARSGIVVNGLAIVNEEAELASYYERSVIGGPGAFAIEVADYEGFADAIRRKLLRELGTPIASSR